MKKLLATVFMLLVFVASQAKIRYDIVVAKDGSGNYTTIQEAINAVPEQSSKRVAILIKKGTYQEKLVVPASKPNISFIGEDKFNTIITYGDYSGKGNINTFTSYTVLVRGDCFYAESITFDNSAGPVGQAVALHIEAHKVIINNCRIIGNQDTLLTGKDRSFMYFLDCYIEGTTDFIFGSSTCVFQTTTIHTKKNSYITAASTPENTAFGYVFLNCKLTADTAFKKIYLGRPWRPFAKTVFLNTEMGDHILPAGWHNWSKPDAEKTAFYAEYKSTGPGANSTQRVAWSHQLTEEQANKYTLKKIFPKWKPLKVIGKHKK